MSVTAEKASAWFADRAKNTPMPGARAMFEIAATALREKAEREDPKPLTLEELRQMDGQPVYVSDLRRPQNSEYCIIRADEPFVDKYSCAQIAGCECDWYDFDQYGDRWIAYRHKPKEG